MPSPTTCPECGAALPASSPHGLCPKCLLLGGDQPSEATKPTPGAAARPTIRLDLPHDFEKAGDRIGRYKLLEQLGEGGCGIVYMAEQTEPVTRRVALKVIKLGMDTREFVARFEAERQALALMDHANIAKVLDGGATATGRPYFVMELVRGIPITRYCDEHRLDTTQRLELFILVCQAIQHAHQKGIIHRDLKPSNILVADHDGTPVPKVIDFGIAKATAGQKLTDKTLFTAFEQFIGTPAYMSPEQARLSGLDIDTRSDIYSLGVLLYELLTGKTPFDAKRLVQAGLDEIRRIIQEEDPPRPSTRVSTLNAAEQQELATNRQSEAPKVARLVRGDLDWIVMKALEKDRNRRYESANGVAMDLKRFLDNEPVVARPPSRAYRLQKLVRRNKVIFGAAGAVVLALLVGFVGVVVEWQQAKASARKAQTEAARSTQVAQFLKSMLEGVGPSVALGRDTKMLREILDKTAERVGKDLTNQPEVEVELRATLAQTYEKLGLWKRAEEIARENLRLARSRLGAENLAVADALQQIGDDLTSLYELEEAETFERQALAMKRKLLGNDHPSVAASLGSLAFVVRREGKLAEAETMHREALALSEKLLGNDHPIVADSIYYLALALQYQGKFAEAETMHRRALRMKRQLFSKEDPAVLDSLVGLASVLGKQGKLAEAETMHREALVMKRKLLGEEHPDITESLIGLADVLRQEGKEDEIERLYREHLQFLRVRLSADDPALAAALITTAAVLLDEGKFTEAEPLIRECLVIREKKLPDNWSTFNARSMLGACLLAQKRFPEAEPLLLSGYEGLKQRADKIPADARRRLTEALWRLVRLYETTGRPDQAARWKTEATQWYRKQVEEYRKAAESGNMSVPNNLAWLLATCVDPEIRDGRSAVTFAEKAVVATNRRDAMFLDTLAAAYAEAGEFSKAVSVQKEAIALLHTEKENSDYTARLKLYESNSPCREP